MESNAEKQEHNGAKDFDEVLASASDASAYGSRRGEDPEGSATAAADGGSEVQLDLRKLSDMLECIPLPQRLGVPGDRLLPEQMAEFERIARHRLKAFDERVKGIANSEIRGDWPKPSTDKDLNKVKSALRSRAPDEANDEENEADDDEDGLNPEDIVDWLDKVLSK